MWMYRFTPKFCQGAPGVLIQQWDCARKDGHGPGSDCLTEAEKRGAGSSEELLDELQSLHRQRYGAFFSRRTRPLDPSRVPLALQSLPPYAEIRGISDDIRRDRLVENAPSVAKADLLALIPKFNKQFDAWLAGPEADAGEWSDEYILHFRTCGLPMTICPQCDVTEDPRTRFAVTHFDPCLEP